MHLITSNRSYSVNKTNASTYRIWIMTALVRLSTLNLPWTFVYIYKWRHGCSERTANQRELTAGGVRGVHNTANHTKAIKYSRPNSVFTARCYASAVLAMALCLSVCPSVCLSQVGVLLKRLNMGLHEQCDSPGTLVFWRQRFPRNSTGVNHLLHGHQMQKYSDF